MKQEHNTTDSVLIQHSVKIAKINRYLYEAYIEQGFSDEQAMFLVSKHIEMWTKAKFQEGDNG